jgi:hypothetical protein
MSRAKVIVVAFVAMLALSAVASATASAATAGWMINGKTLTGTESAKLSTTAEVMESVIFRDATAGVTIQCTGVSINSVAPVIEAPDKASATSFTFTDCTATSPCTVPASIITVPLSVLATLEGVLGIKTTFTPKTGTTFTTIKFGGTGCALTGVKTVVGKTFLDSPTGQDEKAIQEDIALESTKGVFLASDEATVSGAALLSTEKGEAWSFL